MKRYDWKGLALVAAALVLAAIFMGCQGQGTNVTVTQTPKVDPVARGRYLVAVGGCNDCHTPLKMSDKGPVPDTTEMLSGHPQDLKMPVPPKPQGPWVASIDQTFTAFAGPWGSLSLPTSPRTPRPGSGNGARTSS